MSSGFGNLNKIFSEDIEAIKVLDPIQELIEATLGPEKEFSE